MKEVLKPIYELITGEYTLFDNIIYNYIVMTIVLFISYIIAFRLVGKLYNQKIINSRTTGSILHWGIRIIVFL